MGIQLKKLVQIFGNDISMEMPSNKHLGNKNEQHLALAIKHDNSTNNYVDKRLARANRSCVALLLVVVHFFSHYYAQQEDDDMILIIIITSSSSYEKAASQ